MKISTIPKYLLGNEKAILEVASSRAATFIGFFLVFSAAIARNYDQVYLLKEPIFIFTPLLASLFNSFFIFIFVYFCTNRKISFWKQYRCFLNIFLMTAPLAWLYAIPIEMLSSSSYFIAVFNLSLLGIVSVWRIWLVARSLKVLLKIKFWESFGIIMFPISIVVAFISFQGIAIHVARSMSGLARSPESEVIGLFIVGALFSAPVLFLIGLVILIHMIRSKSKSNLQLDTQKTRFPFVAMLLCFIFWIALAIIPQQKAKLSFELKELLSSRNLRYYNIPEIKEAIQLMSAHQPSDFCAAQPIPPEYKYLEYLAKIIGEMDGKESPWIHEVYLKYLGENMSAGQRQRDYSDDLVEKTINFLEIYPKRKQWVQKYKTNIEKCFHNRPEYLEKILSMGE